jgi:CRISPR/Cas system-associated exonuclease Cas4 (RecB family)
MTSLTQKLYGGKYTLTLDDDHNYILDHTEARPLGVTTPIKLADKSFLQAWYAKETCLATISGVQSHVVDDEFGQKQVRIPLDEFVEICTKAKFAAPNIAKEAREVGSEIHDFAETYAIKGSAPMPTHPQAVKCCTSLVGWFARPGRRIVETERLVFSPTHFYAGKFDRLDEVEELGGDWEVLDFKSSSMFNDEMPLQLSGYAIALEEEFGRYIKWGTIVRIDKKTGLIEERRYELTDDHKQCFLHLLEAYRSLQKVKGPSNAIRKRAA